MTTGPSQFTRINESFVCFHCGAQVPPATQTCRDHCPYCLWSLHVDINPGDRAETCKGELQPLGYRKKNKKMLIVYRCNSCGAQRVNKFLERDEACPDSYDTLLTLSGETS